MIRALALSNDGPDVWGLAYDFSSYFDEISWPDTMRRTVYMNLLERLVNANNVQAAEKIHSDVTEWATEREDRDMLAWLLYLGSRLDTRRKDLYRARDRARDASKLYEALENNIKVAEIENHMAMIELEDGNPNAALEHTKAAVDKGKTATGEEGEFSIAPGILASAEHIRGLVARRAGQLQPAAEHFKKANEIAGQAGLGPLALDAGLSFGESLLASGQSEPARDVLGRVLVIAQQLRNPNRERTACELLAQAEGSLKNYDRAIPLANRVLQLSQQLKLNHALPIDLYNLGFFHFVTKQPTEALAFFKQAEQGADVLGQHPVVKELYYFKGLAHLQTGDAASAKASFTKGVPYAETAKDWRKLCSTLENLATIEKADGNVPAAKEALTKAIEFAKQANLKDERKGLRKKLDALR
jgi:tetratricopeptide (TPR) repeat protein